MYPRTIENGAGERLVFLGVTHAAGDVRMEIEGFANAGAGPPMHVHYLQEEVVRVISGRMGHQVLGQEPQFAGPGDQVVWPAGTPHKWWNAGETELHATGWCAPPDNMEFYLSTVFASMTRHHGKRPGLFDLAFLMTRYKNEHAMTELPAAVSKALLPMLYGIGKLLGTYRAFRNAPEPVTAARRG